MSLFDIFKKDDGISLVLGGGGVRGFFHVGVINALRDSNIRVSRISGTSIGAIVGAMYAADPKIDFTEVINELNFISISKLIASTYSRDKTTSLEKFFKKHIKAQEFKDLKIPLTFNATDINNKKEIIFRSGNLFPGLAASIAIPGVFPPVKFGDTFLIDGGIMNSIPVSHIKGSKKVLVSDITGPIKIVDDSSNNIDVLYSSISLLQQVNSMNLIKAEGKRHKLIHLELDDRSTFILDFRKKNYQSLIDLGYKAVKSHLSDLSD